MEKEKSYQWTKFSPSVIKEAIAVFRDRVAEPDCASPTLLLYMVQMGDEQWSYDAEDEYFAHYRQGVTFAQLWQEYGHWHKVAVRFNGVNSTVAVRAKERGAIEAVFEVFESHASEARIHRPETTSHSKPVIFIGHGRNLLWRDLKDHLHEKHGYPIEAYEIGARAGHAIRDILEEMLEESSMAFLVMTGEDETADGGLRARQNVVHEAGLFQGRLGFSRAIMVVEDETEAFSNLDGVQQIRFSKGNIREAYGEVLATIRREFGASMD